MVQPVSASPGAYYYHTDPGGTPLAITGNQCNVVWRGFYEPFGNEYNISGTISNDMRFVGNEKDNETGLNYFSARYLDVTLGRFLAPDPVGPVDSNTGKISDTILTAPQSLNGYAYAGNNPVSFADPLGLSLVQVPDNLLPPRHTFSQSLNFALREALLFVASEMILPLPIEPASPVGRRGNPMKVPRGANESADINGRNYTGHALDQMQGRGIPSSVDEDTIATGSQSPSYDGATVYTTDQAQVVLNPDGSVKTVIPQ